MPGVFALPEHCHFKLLCFRIDFNFVLNNQLHTCDILLMSKLLENLEAASSSKEGITGTKYDY